MNQIIISDIKIDLIRKNIKNIYLAVYPPIGCVQISAPLQADEDAIRLFAVSKIGWIKKHQKKIANQKRIPKREYKEGATHYFLGKKYLLRIKDTKGAGRADITDKTYLDLYVKPGSSLEYKKYILKEWYRAELKKIIPEMIIHWEKKIGVKIEFWQIKQMKTRWGSCNVQKKRIWLNLELARKPVRCLEYVLVHEMVHIHERHHNKRFKSLLDYYLLNWKQLKDELNCSSPELDT